MARLGWRLSDQLALEVSGALARAQDRAGAEMLWGVWLGIRWTFSVLRLEPSFHLSFGGAGVEGQISGIGLQAGFALDWRVTRKLAVGVEVDWRGLVSELSRLPMWITVGPRVEWRSAH